MPAGRGRVYLCPPAALHRFALLTAVATFFLIIAGALVVGNEAGLAVPDWPLSYGAWMPPMEGGIFYEHGHRMVAALVGLLTTVLVVWLWRREPRRWVRRLGWVALLAVILQGVLGGITVLYLLPTPVSVSHACLAQLFFCLTLSLALFTGPSWNLPSEPIEDHRTAGFRHLCAASSAAIFLQLVTGAALRHKAVDVVPHLAWAAVVSALVGYVVVRAMKQLPEQRPLQGFALTMGVLLIAQLALGGISYFARAAHEQAPQPVAIVVWTTTAHVAVGALLLGTSWLLTLLAFRRLGAPGRLASWRESPHENLA